MIKTSKLLRVAGACMGTMVVTACGGSGGSGGPPPVTTYTVSATAGTGGSISPSSATVNSGATTTLTVTPAGGYVINSVSGCGGSLSGNTYTTGSAGANCAVTASFSAAFTWISGSDTSDATGVYGTEGTPAASNMPGARHGPITWMDGEGNLWLYGGYGVGSPIFNDMWMYTPSTGLWTWERGSGTPDAAAVYGTLGLAQTTNTPGGLAASAYSWTDSLGNVWLFGGYGYDSTGTRGWLNALWEYSPQMGQWTWQGGSTTHGAAGVYGTLGVAASTNYPGARAGGGWQEKSGNVWIFGGSGYDSNGTLGNMNDLWEYSPSTGMWTWVSGSNTIAAPGSYGTRGTAASTNLPGAREGYATWTDANGNLWLFGGIAYDSTHTQGNMNDLWEYSPSTGMWIWVSGSNTVNAQGVYGTQGTAAATNVPGARHYATAWVDSAGNLWMLGGTVVDASGNNPAVINDLWKYSPTSNQWTWVGGSDTSDAMGVYGTQGVTAATNVLGARDGVVTWTDTTSGNVWLFGGEGYNSTGADPAAATWNDLWKYPIQ